MIVTKNIASYRLRKGAKRNASTNKNIFITIAIHVGDCNGFARCANDGWKGFFIQLEISLAIVDVQTRTIKRRSRIKLTTATYHKQIQIAITIGIKQNALHVFFVLRTRYQIFTDKWAIFLLQKQLTRLRISTANEEVFSAITIHIAGADERSFLGIFLLD